MSQVKPIPRVDTTPANRVLPFLLDGGYERIEDLAQAVRVEASVDRTVSRREAGDPGRVHSAPDASFVYQAAAAFVANSIYDQALKQDDPAAVLAAIIPEVPNTLPAALRASMGVYDGALPGLLQDGVTDRLRAFADIERARVGASESLGGALGVMEQWIRNGADPAAVGERVLALAIDSAARE